MDDTTIALRTTDGYSRLSYEFLDGAVILKWDDVASLPDIGQVGPDIPEPLHEVVERLAADENFVRTYYDARSEAPWGAYTIDVVSPDGKRARRVLYAEGVRTAWSFPLGGGGGNLIAARDVDPAKAIAVSNPWPREIYLPYVKWGEEHKPIPDAATYEGDIDFRLTGFFEHEDQIRPYYRKAERYTGLTLVRRRPKTPSEERDAVLTACVFLAVTCLGVGSCPPVQFIGHAVRVLEQAGKATIRVAENRRWRDTDVGETGLGYTVEETVYEFEVFGHFSGWIKEFKVVSPDGNVGYETNHDWFSLGIADSHKKESKRLNEIIPWDDFVKELFDGNLPPESDFWKWGCQYGFTREHSIPAHIGYKIFEVL